AADDPPTERRSPLEPLPPAGRSAGPGVVYLRARKYDRREFLREWLGQRDERELLPEVRVGRELDRRGRPRAAGDCRDPDLSSARHDRARWSRPGRRPTNASTSWSSATTPTARRPGSWPRLTTPVCATGTPRRR